ncbi:MAG: AAA family ATPase [Deltaproteobacteria bacterium]|nr:MAG: AAA family ATPase [Deltaproteobacteria bacterium]
MILGLSGTYGAGKGEICDYLAARSFEVHSLSDVIRDALRARGHRETRERMIETGTALRAEHGEGVLAERVLGRLEPDRNYVIDSIRHPEEVARLRAARPDFRLIWVDADASVRLARIGSRGRSGDPANADDLDRLEGSELASADPAAQQLVAVRDRADFAIRNDGTREELHAAIRRVLDQCLHFERPDWDDYFMSIARVVASRSNCVKRKVAAVITRDRRIISTGYNGTPRGVRNCNEGGCPRCNAFAEAGTQLSDCLCSHGEENAITQAAYHGVSVRGGTLYTTLCPCLICTKMIINAGIEAVVYNADYPLGDVSLGLLHQAGVKVRQLAIGS